LLRDEAAIFPGVVYAMGERTVRGVFHTKAMVEGGGVVRLYSKEADSVRCPDVRGSEGAG